MVIGKELTELLTVTEVAAMLHVHTNTVRRWANQGLIHAHRICHRGDRRFDLQDVNRFLEEMNPEKT
jgi:excisionase family DNA binding protein